MPDIDLSRLPTGTRGWAALVAWAVSSDDRLERHFLELKSDVDLTTKHGQHKVAKFILGAANRDPGRSAKRLGGHALLILGVEAGTVTGIPSFEAKDLEHEVRKFTGADGPPWDFERIPVDAGNDVIVIIVDPPTGYIWPCLADGIKLCNGDIYLRGDGDTRKATGQEVKVMLTRTATTSTLPRIEVEIVGQALAVRVDLDLLTDWVQETTRNYIHQVGSSARGSVLDTFTATPGLMERRTKAGFRREVQRWQESALADPASGVDQIAARLATGIRLRVANPARISLRDVRVDFEFDGEVLALEWEDVDDDPPLKLFADRPVDWGHDTSWIANAYLGHHPIPNGGTNGIIRITQRGQPARLSLSLDLLRPEETYLTHADETVLILYVNSQVNKPIAGRWRLTSGDFDDVLDGAVSVPVEYQDLTALITRLTDA